MNDLERSYAEAGFAARLGAGAHPALLVVDLVRAYLEPESPFYVDGEAARASTQRLVDAARDTGHPVIFTTVRYAQDGVDGGLFVRKVPTLLLYADPDDPLADFPATPRPRGDELVIVKQYASAFFGTTLASTLQAHDIDTLVLAGYSTSGCIRASATDAIQHGFRPLVVREAVADRDPGVHETNLFDLDAKYADVIAESEALDLLARPSEV
ncbi:MAG: isochorismatase family protein [Nitriliruptor sp.]|nr:MAG: isochorismatase family protein [Nitriliruptor sp.]